MRSLLLLATLLTPPAFAGGQASDVAGAEARRLSGELSTLARRQAWRGVDRTYRALVQGGAALELQDHLLGADAARALGDLATCRARLLAAVAHRADWVALERLHAFDSQHTAVNLHGTALEATAAAFAPEHREALAFARTALARDGRFAGYLPQGRYRLDGVAWDLAAEPFQMGTPPRRRRRPRRR